MKKKTKEVYDSYYYDGRRKCWRKENIAHSPIKKPEEALVEYWLQEWEKTDGYPEQEKALDKLFNELLPNNEELEDILIKVCTLNDFYSTNIYKVIDVAKVIQEMQIDESLRLKQAEPQLIDKLNEKVYEKTGRHIYSFASKYFSHHLPEQYPIYDSYVDKLLRYYRDETGFCEFEDVELSNYERFSYVVQEFIKFYKLDKYDVKAVDKMLWQMGKYHFPKYKEE